MTVLRLVVAGIATCFRAALGAVGLFETPDFFLAEKYFGLSEHYRGRILDLGSGRGRYAAFLRARGHSVVAMDVADASDHEDIVPIVFDGHTIPCENDSFDVGLCMFVLHHVEDQEELLRELRRVVRSTVIIAEDLRENAWDSFWAALHARLTDWGRAGRGFPSDAEWRERFRTQGLTVRKQVTIPRWRLPYYPVLRVVYVLDIVEEKGARQARPG